MTHKYTLSAGDTTLSSFSTAAVAGGAVYAPPKADKAQEKDDALSWLDKRVDEVRGKAFACA